MVVSDYENYLGLCIILFKASWGIFKLPALPGYDNLSDFNCV